MTAQIAKDGIDLGIVVRDIDTALGFYRDTLGLEFVAEMPMPGPTPGTMHRLACGSSTIKLVDFETAPEAVAARGGPSGGSGYRYFTIAVSNLAEVSGACRDAGHRVLIESMEVRPGVAISMIEDPDGNWVELVQDDT